MDNWIAVADLVTLMGTLGLEGPAVRAAIGRLKKKGLLQAVSKEGIAGYCATPDLLSVLDKGEARIFTSEVPADLSDGWILAVFSVPESERENRRQLRKQLTALGFGPIASGVFIAPARVEVEAKALLDRNSLAGYVHLFEADHLGFASTKELVDAAWDSANIGAGYVSFVEQHQERFDLAVAATAPAHDAFICCMSALEDWRPLSYRDPGLADEIQDFAKERTLARELFSQIGAELKDRANAYVKANMRQYRNGALQPPPW